MRESKIEAYLVKQVKAAGGEVRKVKWIGRANAPDRLVFLPAVASAFRAVTILVELKATGEKPRAAQTREHARILAVGGNVLVIDSIEAVDDLISLRIHTQQKAARLNAKWAAEDAAKAYAATQEPTAPLIDKLA